MNKGAANFTKMIVETRHLLTKYKAPPRLQQVCNLDGEGLAFVQGKGATPHVSKRETISKNKIECWHCNKMGHCKNKCPKLQVLGMGVQNINIDKCNKEHTLLSANNGYGLLQKQEKGVQGFLSIDACPSYTSTPYPHLLANFKKEEHGLIGHSNAGSCGMDYSREMGALKQMWLNKGSAVTIIPLQQLEVTYNSRHHGGAFVVHTDNGNIILHKN
jgi:hypothetical protein